MEPGRREGEPEGPLKAGDDMQRNQWADQGQALRFQSDAERGVRCMGASRLGSVEVACREMSLWVQVRGSSWIEAREGRFYLRAGEWIGLSRDSAPMVQADRDGLCIGISVPDEALKAMSRFSDFDLHVGHGRLRPGDTRAFARQWYRAWRHADAEGQGGRLQATQRSVLLFLEGVQDECRRRVRLCPGSSLGRKRQVFERMQRARLFLQGNSHRNVRVTELAERAQFSLWYFSKVFTRLYGESPQIASSRMRLDHAASLLTSTSMTIGEIAEASGFDNNCSFARSFRTRYAMTASEYRAAGRPAGQIAQACSAQRADHITRNRNDIAYNPENRQASRQT